MSEQATKDEQAEDAFFKTDFSLFSFFLSELESQQQSTKAKL